MKKLLALLFSIFLLSSASVFADDISEFSIEGISIGDSLLDYMTEDEILAEIQISKSLNDYSYLSEPKKYLEVYAYNDFPIYEKMSFFIKNNSTNQYVSNKNEKYTILFIRGMISYIEDFEGCIAKRDEIVEVLSGMFPNSQKIESVYPTSGDSNGDVNEVSFDFDSGNSIGAYCANYDETWRIKNNRTEGLTVQIKSKEIFTWLDNYK